MIRKFALPTTYRVAARSKYHLLVTLFMGVVAGCGGMEDSGILPSSEQSVLSDRHDSNILLRSTATTGAAGSGNVLSNAGFESGLNGWEACDSALSTQITTDSSNGNNALEIGAGNCVQQVLKLRAGVEYQLSCDAKTLVNSGWTGMGLSHYNSDLAFIEEAVARIESRNYQNYTVALPTPNNTNLSLVWVYTDDGAVLDNCSLIADGAPSGSLLSYSRTEKFIEFQSRDDIVFNDRFDGDFQVRVQTLDGSTQRAAYVSRRNGTQLPVDWTITIPGYNIWSADVSGNRLVIGASIRSVFNVYLDGAAFIYELIDGSWQLQSTVTLPLAVENATRDLDERINFGHSVALSGDYLIVGASRRPVGAEGSTVKGAESTIFELNGTEWQQVFQDVRFHTRWQNMSANRWFDPYVEIDDRRALMSHILGPVLYLRENGAWSVADIEHSYSFVGATTEDGMRKSPQGYLVYSHDEAINSYYAPSLRFIGNQLRTFHHDFESNLCPVSLINGCPVRAPIHIFNFDNEPLEDLGSKASVTKLNIWNEAARSRPRTEGRGFIATYSCVLEQDAPNGVAIDFNYRGPATDVLGWSITYLGDIEASNTAPGGSYGLKPVSNIQSFLAGDTLEFEFLANDASFIDSDFNTRCIPM